MNTKSKRYLDRSQSISRVPRHYSHLIEDSIFVKTGLTIIGGIAIFLVIIVISALAGY